MIPQIICWISLPEIGYIVGIAVILFGCKACLLYTSDAADE